MTDSFERRKAVEKCLGSCENLRRLFVLSKSSGLLILIVVAQIRVIPWCWIPLSFSRVSSSSMYVWGALAQFQIFSEIT